MNRRDFLGALLGGMAVTAAGLYLPSTKVFSFPSEIIVPAGVVSLTSFSAMLKEVYKEMVLDLYNSEPIFYRHIQKAHVPWA